MSGGSFDYLFTRVRPLGEQRDVIERMAEKLSELDGGEAATAATRRILALLDEADRLADSLVDPWHAVEWWWSGDWGYEDMIEDVQKYREPAPSAILMSTQVLSEADYQELKRRFLAAQQGGEPLLILPARDNGPDDPRPQEV